MTPARLERVRELRALCSGVLDQMPWSDACATFHPDLSPAAWHAGHAFYTEALWLSETVWQDDSLTAAWRDLFQADASHKNSRAARLPDESQLRAWCRHVGIHCDALWSRTPSSPHPLLMDGYLGDFLIQHYCQHLETLCMVRQQRQLCREQHAPAAKLHPQPSPLPVLRRLEARGVMVGAHQVAAPYDNELPTHEVKVGPIRIAERPVSNAEWLAYMASTGGPSPQHWRGDMTEGWYGIEESGAVELAPAAPVEGLGHEDAVAYARWAGARLPHEHEWEAAAGLLGTTGVVWEWCANSLMPYPGFRPFPYDGYSLPWFDGAHYVLRGGSRRTQSEIRRPSFRNFYLSGHRHVFAGLRLVFD